MNKTEISPKLTKEQELEINCRNLIDMAAMVWLLQVDIINKPNVVGVPRKTMEALENSIKKFSPSFHEQILKERERFLEKAGTGNLLDSEKVKKGKGLLKFFGFEGSKKI